MQARYYDPVIGRFYSNDPIGFRDVHSFNRYAYANNNPYKYTDPDGRASELSYLNRPMGVSIVQNRAATAKGGGMAAKFALTRNPAGLALHAVVEVAIIAYNESSDSSENKGQTKPEVGDCPDCGGDTSNKEGKIAKDHGQKVKDTKQRIHGLKNKAKISGNPDVEVCQDCGEVFPQTESGELGDSIGNIDENF